MSDGAPLSDAAVSRLRAQLATPRVIAGRYELGAELGRGGMGVVHRATDQVLGRAVAIKLLAVDAPAEQFGGALKREFSLLARLEHPGIVPVYDAGFLDDGRVFYVMRLVEGARLDAWIFETRSRGAVLRALLRVAEAVAFAHRQGVLHCDLKPANVMIGPLGDVLVLDWGIAQLVSAVGGGAGTPGYMAPEQRAPGAVLIPQTDVFALGSMLRDFLEAGHGPIERPLRSIVAKATAESPAVRYDSAESFAEDLRRQMDGEKVLAHREGVVEQLVRLAKRHQTVLLLFAAYVVVRVFVLLWRGI